MAVGTLKALIYNRKPT